MCISFMVVTQALPRTLYGIGKWFRVEVEKFCTRRGKEERERRRFQL